MGEHSDSASEASVTRAAQQSTTADHGAGRPAVVAIDMGYGHMRAARALADALGTRVMHLDREPLASASETRFWARSRRFYERVSRTSQVPWVGAPFRTVLDAATDIAHLHPLRDLSSPNTAAVWLERLLARGMGSSLVDYLRQHHAPLLTTFYAPAIIAARAGCERVYCVVTDVDLNRVWVPMSQRAAAGITYLAPSLRAQHRLLAYGVRPEQIIFTGFPLPPTLLGGSELQGLRTKLMARIERLDPAGVFRQQYSQELEHFAGMPVQAPSSGIPAPPRLTFAVGGAGAQVGIVRELLPSVSQALRSGELRLSLVAGVRPEVAAAFEQALEQTGNRDLLGTSVDILLESDFDSYYDRFNILLAETDILWTKPSEMTFYGALGIPLLFARPVGKHEHYNRRWAIEHGAGLKQRDAGCAWDWLREWLHEGMLAAAAWSGYMRMPKFGTPRIAKLFEGEASGTSKLC